MDRKWKRYWILGGIAAACVLCIVLAVRIPAYLKQREKEAIEAGRVHTNREMGTYIQTKYYDIFLLPPEWQKGAVVRTAPMHEKLGCREEDYDTYRKEMLNDVYSLTVSYRFGDETAKLGTYYLYTYLQDCQDFEGWTFVGILRVGGDIFCQKVTSGVAACECP